MHFLQASHLLIIDRLSQVMLSLIIAIGLITGLFALRYLEGDRKRSRFIRLFLGLVAALLVLVCANNVLLFFSAWLLANTLLVKLMVHKSHWQAAKSAGDLALTMLSLGSLCLGGGLALLSWQTQSLSLQHMTQMALPFHPATQTALVLLIMAAVAQSALWPCHRWLLSSLNSPTPVSALMHAGLVNGGGFLLARFAPLYFQANYLLTVIFSLGALSALLGTLWALLQPAVKRQLACSTLAQMGFMVMQCGLGFFASAIAHLVCHGFFKASAFFYSPSTPQSKACPLEGQVWSWIIFVFACLLGLFSSAIYAWAAQVPWLSHSTQQVLVFIAFISATQLAFNQLQQKTRGSFVAASIVSCGFGLLYGISRQLFELLLAPLALSQPQPLNVFHDLVMFAFMGCWLSSLFYQTVINYSVLPAWYLRGYVAALNASRPHPQTITPHRNSYCW